jgi:broad specificity phosphatase PhoE
MAGSWRSAPTPLAAWREDALAVLGSLREDSVIFSHYVAINVAAGSALGDDRVVVFSPDNCSVTIFETENGKLHLLEKGFEAPLTKVN